MKLSYAKPAKSNKNTLALIIGVSDYENTPAKAIYADTDAMVFRDYASEKLGIPDNRIKTLVNDGADEREMLLAIQSWLLRSVKQDQTFLPDKKTLVKYFPNYSVNPYVSSSPTSAANVRLFFCFGQTA